MVWLKKPSVSAFQNFLQIENQLNIKKVMGRHMWMCFCIDSVNIDCTECIRDPCPVSTVSIYIVYSNIIVYLCMVILFVDTVDMKIKAYNALNAMFCRDCRYTVVLWLLHKHLIESTMRCENTSIDSLDIA